MVVSPNTTLTLESVPAQMAGAAGGALQTAQRIGAALGTALLATVYYHSLTAGDRGFEAAVSDALLAAAGLMLLALLIAVADLVRARHRVLSPRAEPGAATAPAPAWPTPHGAVTR
jgi:hypothetical protein